MISKLTLSFPLGLLLGASFSSVIYYYFRPKGPSTPVKDGVISLIGNTPLIRIKSLSDALGIDILGKAEFLNPGGSVKDRVAIAAIEKAENAQLITPHTACRVVEGTVGSTGISLAVVARAKGYLTSIVMPDDVAQEKVQALQCLGADVQRVRPASIVDKRQFVNLAKEYTSEQNASGSNNSRAFFVDQFENSANFDAHFQGTGPEIYMQTGGRIDAFVSGSGTGGTISGVASYLRMQKPDVRVILADPEGSGLFNRVRFRTMFAPQEKEGTKRRHQVDTIVEGIGLNRLTQNFKSGEVLINDAVKVTDHEALAMSRWLVERDGLFLGSSSAVNLVASVREALAMRKRGVATGTVVTILCDHGHRHYSKFWNQSYLDDHDYKVDTGVIEALLHSQVSQT